MNVKIAIFVTLLSAAALSSCSRTCEDLRAEPGEKYGNPVTDVATGETQPEPVVAEGKDNSRIVTTRDIYGSLIETRTFRDHSLIDNLVIKTLPDGTKLGNVFDKSGNKFMLVDNQIALALNASGDDLVDSLGLAQAAAEPSSIPTVSKVAPSLLSETNTLPSGFGTGRAEPLIVSPPPTLEPPPPMKTANTTADGAVADEKLIRIQHDLRNVPELRRTRRSKS